MSGYDLNEGFYRDQNVSEDELWLVFTSFFSSQTKMVSSYKYGLLKAIIDNLYNTDEELKLTFDQLFSKFGEIYWNLILKHGLQQQSKKETSLEQILHETADKYEIPNEIPYESLTADIMAEVANKIKKKCKRYVLGALYEDTKQLFYSFSKKEEWIQINPLMYEFLCKHKVVIEKLNYYEWARFLEGINEGIAVNRLLGKIDESSKRNNLSFYKSILLEKFESKCFYCGKAVSAEDAEADHFIPWSFIKDDNLWNLVIACPKCNNRKRDKLADRKYLYDLADRNDSIILEEHQEMRNYKKSRLTAIYDWALKNGYEEIWNP